MCDMGVYFEPPRLRAKKAWAIMELLSINGYRFHSEGTKPFVKAFILSGRPTLEGARRRIELMRQEFNDSSIRPELERYKEAKKLRS
jgi:hypothetical protein